jgi:hypothetical protein
LSLVLARYSCKTVAHQLDPAILPAEPQLLGYADDSNGDGMRGYVLPGRDLLIGESQQEQSQGSNRNSISLWQFGHRISVAVML